MSVWGLDYPVLKDQTGAPTKQKLETLPLGTQFDLKSKTSGQLLYIREKSSEFEFPVSLRLGSRSGGGPALLLVYRRGGKS